MQLISVIVPIYNVEKYLRQCIESIINQTYRNLEIILVNDGSQDNCGMICEEYKKIDSRIKVIHKINGGLSDARNAGIDIATGDYIAFVDSDDFIKDNMYELLLELVNKYNADIAICGVQKTNGKIINTVKQKKIVEFTPFEALKEMLTERSFNTSAWDKLYKRELFNNIRYPKGKIYEDLFTTYKVFDISKKIVFVNEECYYYRDTPGSITNSKFKSNQLHLLEASEELNEYIRNNHPSLEKIASQRYTRYTISLLHKMIQANHQDSKIEKTLQQIIRRNYLLYIFSKYNYKSKIFGGIVCIDFRLCKLLCKLF